MTAAPIVAETGSTFSPHSQSSSPFAISRKWSSRPAIRSFSLRPKKDFHCFKVGCFMISSTSQDGRRMAGFLCSVRDRAIPYPVPRGSVESLATSALSGLTSFRLRNLFCGADDRAHGIGAKRLEFFDAVLDLQAAAYNLAMNVDGHSLGSAR